MTQVSISPFAGVGAQFFDNNGVILTGGKVYSYVAGTTTPLATYTSISGATPHANPIVLDSAGRVPGGEIWIEDGKSYKFVVETAASVLIGTYDNVNEIAPGFITIANHVGDGATTVFGIGDTPTTKLATNAYINGVYQDKNTYTVSGSSLTFTQAPPLNSQIEIVTQQTAVLGTTSADLVSYTAPEIRAVEQTVQTKLDQTISVKDFGAVGDGVADDTAAIQSAIDAMDAYSALYFPAGNYKVTSKITFDPPQNNVGFFGDGASATTLRYAGAVANDDCFVFGTSGAQRAGWSISGIRFISDTVMSAGAGVHAYAINRSTWRDVVFSDQDANSNFYIGVWFDGADMVQVSQFRARGSAEGLRVNGITGLGRADLFLHEGKISNSDIGLHVAGNFGGLYVDATDIINNGTNVKISQDVVAINNRETFFGPGALIDTASTTFDTNYDGINVDVTDTGGFIFFDGTWNATCGTAIRIGASYAGTMILNGGIIFNCFNSFGGAGDGIRMLGNSRVYVNNTEFRNIDNVAIGCDAANTNAKVRFPSIHSDVVTAFQNVKSIVTSQGKISSGVDGDPAFSVVGSNSSLVAFQSTGVAWLSASLSRSNTYGVHTAVNGEFAGISLAGSDGTQFINAASIVAATDGAVSAGIVPSKIVFKATNASGSSTPYWQLRANGTLEPYSNGLFSLGSSTNRIDKVWTETVSANSLATYPDDASAGAGGLVTGDFYKTATGELRVKL